MFPNEEVFRVVDVLVRTALNPIDHARLEIDEDGSWDVTGVIALVEEDILAITALGCEVLEVSVAGDAVLLAQLLPESRADGVSTLACLDGNNLARHGYQVFAQMKLDVEGKG